MESIQPRPPRPCEVGRPKGRRRKNRRNLTIFLAPAAPRFFTTLPDSFGRVAAAKGGGGAVWNPPAIDRELKLVVFPTGNAAPDILGQNRPDRATSLFTTSIVALDLRTGRPKWHFQELHTTFGTMTAQPVVLFRLKKDGKNFKGLGQLQ